MSGERTKEAIGRDLADARSARTAHALRQSEWGWEIMKLEAELRRADGDPGPFVTDHAVVRYLERSGAVDVAAVRRTLALAAETGGIGEDRVEIDFDGLTLICDRGKVVTVVPQSINSKEQTP